MEGRGERERVGTRGEERRGVLLWRVGVSGRGYVGEERRGEERGVSMEGRGESEGVRERGENCGSCSGNRVPFCLSASHSGLCLIALQQWNFPCAVKPAESGAPR